MKKSNPPNFGNYKKALTLTVVCLLVLLSNPGLAQNYPVQVNTQLYPPYSLKLSDYATANSEKMALNVLMTDITESNRQLRFRFSIEGNGLHIRSSDFVMGAAPVFVDGGMPLRLTNLDLRPYFQLQNLQGISPQLYNNPLPEGMYSFCFEVFDWISGQRLSRKSCFQAYLIINDPPFLNLPRKGDLVEARNPQNIMFTWTPRHLNAIGVQYEFELRELWDINIDPQAAFLASPNLYRTNTRNTSLLYGPGETPLLENKTYAWRVRALVTDGISETSVFRNNGFSEIYYFTYTADCRAPQFALAGSMSINSEEITWQPDPGHTGYRVQYRKKGARGAVWFESNAVNPYTTLYNLEAGTTYEYRVGGQCMKAQPNAEARFSYSSIQEFTTPSETEKETYYNCGITPEINITNREPLDNIGVNEVFTAGDFPVTVKQVYGSNGVFSGLGYIVVPYLANTKIAVEFQNIKINTDYQLFDGVLMTTYDKDWGNVDDISDEVEAIKKLPHAIGVLADNLLTVMEDLADQLREGTLTGEDRDALVNYIKERLPENEINEIQELNKQIKALEQKLAETTSEIEIKEIQDGIQVLKNKMADQVQTVREKISDLIIRALERYYNQNRSQEDELYANFNAMYGEENSTPETTLEQEGELEFESESEIAVSDLPSEFQTYFEQQDRYYLYLFSKALALNTDDENLIRSFIDKVLEVEVDLIAILKQGRDEGKSEEAILERLVSGIDRGLKNLIDNSKYQYLE